MILSKLETINKEKIKEIADKLTTDPIEGAVLSRVFGEISKCLKVWDVDALNNINESVVWKGVKLLQVSGRSTKKYDDDIELKKLDIRKSKLQASINAINAQIKERQEKLEKEGKVTITTGNPSLKVTIL